MTDSSGKPLSPHILKIMYTIFDFSNDGIVSRDEFFEIKRHQMCNYHKKKLNLTKPFSAIWSVHRHLTNLSTTVLYIVIHFYWSKVQFVAHFVWVTIAHLGRSVRGSLHWISRHKAKWNALIWCSSASSSLATPLRINAFNGLTDRRTNLQAWRHKARCTARIKWSCRKSAVCLLSTWAKLPSFLFLLRHSTHARRKKKLCRI